MRLGQHTPTFCQTGVFRYDRYVALYVTINSAAGTSGHRVSDFIPANFFLAPGAGETRCSETYAWPMRANSAGQCFSGNRIYVNKLPNMFDRLVKNWQK